MKLTIFDVYVLIEGQEQCDRMKQVCVDAGLDIYDNFNFNYLKKEYRFFYCSNGNFCNWLELEYDRYLPQVTEAKFLTLLNEYKKTLE